MKTIGMLGGMSWQSTVPYYQIINGEVARRLGGLHSAQILLHSVDFAELEANMAADNWDANAAILLGAAQGLESAGADFIIICTNTMHKLAPQLQKGLSVPLLHIADAAADAIGEAGLESIALLGTKPTMQEDFFKERLWARGLEVLLPEPWQMDEVHRIIFEELCLGQINPSSRQFFLSLIDELARQGAQGVILGCTEIGLLVEPGSTEVPLFDTTVIHATQAAKKAIM